MPPPSVLSFSPAGGNRRHTVTINGSGFQASQRDSTITFNGIPATATTWTDTQIVATVPSGTATGQIHVTVNSVTNNTSNGPFEVPNPVITSITPPEAPAGGTITIAGSGFGPSQWIPAGGGITYVGSITLNGADIGVAVSWSDTSITVALPSTATSGSLIVTKYNATSNALADYRCRRACHRHSHAIHRPREWKRGHFRAAISARRNTTAPSNSTATWPQSLPGAILKLLRLCHPAQKPAQPG